MTCRRQLDRRRHETIGQKSIQAGVTTRYIGEHEVGPI